MTFFDTKKFEIIVNISFKWEIARKLIEFNRMNFKLKII